MNASIIETVMNGSEIEQIIVNRLIPALADLERRKMMMALLSLYLVLSKPDMTDVQFTETMKGASGYIAMALSDVTGDEVMN